MSAPYELRGVRYFALALPGTAGGGLLADVSEHAVSTACTLAEVQPLRREDAHALARMLGGRVVPYTVEMAEAREGCRACAVLNAQRVMRAKRRRA